VANPSRRYTILVGERGGAIVGYTVMTLRQDGDTKIGEIVDILSLDDGIAEAAIVKGALAWFLSKKADFVLCHTMREDRIFRTLTKFGFHEHPAFPPNPVVYQMYSAEIDEGTFRNPANWHLTHGDQLDAV
jgi:hypothetical protein